MDARIDSEGNVIGVHKGKGTGPLAALFSIEGEAFLPSPLAGEGSRERGRLAIPSAFNCPLNKNIEVAVILGQLANYTHCCAERFSRRHYSHLLCAEQSTFLFSKARLREMFRRATRKPSQIPLDPFFNGVRRQPRPLLMRMGAIVEHILNAHRCVHRPVCLTRT